MARRCDLGNDLFESAPSCHLAQTASLVSHNWFRTGSKRNEFPRIARRGQRGHATVSMMVRVVVASMFDRSVAFSEVSDSRISDFSKSVPNWFRGTSSGTSSGLAILRSRMLSQTIVFDQKHHPLTPASMLELRKTTICSETLVLFGATYSRKSARSVAQKFRSSFYRQTSSRYYHS